MKLIRNDRKILFSLESKLLDNFSLVNNCPVEKNIVLEVTGSKLVADGFVKNENNINIIEVKLFNILMLWNILVRLINFINH